MQSRTALALAALACLGCSCSDPTHPTSSSTTGSGGAVTGQGGHAGATSMGGSTGVGGEAGAGGATGSGGAGGGTGGGTGGAGGCAVVTACDGALHDGCCPPGCYADTDRDCQQIATTDAFDLASDGEHVFGPVTLADTGTKMQSLAWDDVHHRVYIAQVTDADSSGSGAHHAANGDLTITKLTDTGTIISSMRLRRSGHGVSIGVEPVGADVYLWVEADSHATSDGDIRGTALARVKYDGGTTVSMAGYKARYWPAADAHPTAPEYTCSVEMATGRMAVRYVHEAGGFRVALYNLEDVKAGGTTPLLPPRKLASGMGTFQGYVTSGSFLYALTGDSGKANTLLFSFDWNTGKQRQKAGTAVYGSVVSREPEGMGVQEYGGLRRLTFGIAGQKSASNSTRVANIAYKDGILP